MIHNGIFVVGALVVKGVVVAGHAMGHVLAAHVATQAATAKFVAAPIVKSISSRVAATSVSSKTRL